MKAFETPIVEVKKFDVENILTASSGASTPCTHVQDDPDCYRNFFTCPSDDCPVNVELPCWDD